jgi:PKD repeat protein
MADEKPAHKSWFVHWFRTGLTTVFGLVSGACLMYFSGVINYVIKPAKPLANFETQVNGLKVVFHNRCTGGNDGWWDFGDGTALEPYVATQQTVEHTYTRASGYSIKLSLRNLFGDENERTVNVTVGDPVVAAPPGIDTFEVVPICPDRPNYAPATFKVVSKVKNADMCVWVPGYEHPVEVITDLSGAQERYVTLKQPGYHLLKIAAYGNKQVIEKSQVVKVEPQQAGAVMAVLNVTHQAVHIASESRPHTIAVDVPPGAAGSVASFAKERWARPGFQILAARFENQTTPPNVRGLKLEIAPDKLKVRLTGELVRAANTPLKWVTHVVLNEEQRSPMTTIPLGTVANPLTVPGTTILPMPNLQGGWVSTQRNLTLALHDAAEKTLWQCSAMPRTDELTLGGRRFRLTATEVGGQLRIDVVEVGKAGPLVGN